MSDDLLREFEAAYDTYADSVFRYLIVRLGDRERALELTQDVFMNAWRSLSRGTRVAHMRAFLFRSAHNAFVNEIRTKRGISSLDALAEKGFDPADAAANPLMDALAREALEHVRAAEPYADVLMMRFADGLSVKEIAHILGESENGVSVRIHRGLKKLRKLYGTE